MVPAANRHRVGARARRVPDLHGERVRRRRRPRAARTPERRRQCHSPSPPTRPTGRRPTHAHGHGERLRRPGHPSVAATACRASSSAGAKPSATTVATLAPAARIGAEEAAAGTRRRVDAHRDDAPRVQRAAQGRAARRPGRGAARPRRASAPPRRQRHPLIVRTDGIERSWTTVDSRPDGAPGVDPGAADQREAPGHPRRDLDSVALTAAMLPGPGAQGRRRGQARSWRPTRRLRCRRPSPEPAPARSAPAAGRRPRAVSQRRPRSSAGPWVQPFSTVTLPPSISMTRPVTSPASTDASHATTGELSAGSGIGGGVEGALASFASARTERSR